MNLRGLFIAGLAGVLFSTAWLLVLDGIAYSELERQGNAQHLRPPNLKQPVTHWYYVTPCIGMMLLCILLNLASSADLHGGTRHSVRKNQRDLGYFMSGAFLLAGYVIPIYLHHIQVLPLNAVLLSLSGSTCIICSVMIFIRFFTLTSSSAYV